MTHRIVLKPTAAKDLSKLPHTIRKRMALKLQYFLTQDDPLAFAAPLVGKVGEYRFRVGSYRVAFDVSGQTIIILHIEHRREVYRRR